MISASHQNVMFSNMESPEENICTDSFQELIGTKHIQLDKYYCDKCRFSSKDHMQFKKHVLQHKEIKFSCSYCNHISYTKGESQRHLVQHTGTFPYKCEFCDYGAVRNDYIVKHTQRVHGTGKKRGLSNDPKARSGDSLPLQRSLVESKHRSQTSNLPAHNTVSCSVPSSSTIRAYGTTVNIKAGNQDSVMDGVLNRVVGKTPTEERCNTVSSSLSMVQVELIEPLKEPIEPDMPLMVEAPPDLFIPPDCFVELVEVKTINGTKELELKIISHVSETGLLEEKTDNGSKEADGCHKSFPCNHIPSSEKSKLTETRMTDYLKEVFLTGVSEDQIPKVNAIEIQNRKPIPMCALPLSKEPEYIKENLKSSFVTKAQDSSGSVLISVFNKTNSEKSALEGNSYRMDLGPISENGPEKNTEVNRNNKKVVACAEWPVISSVFSLCRGTEDFPDCVRWERNLEGVCGHKFKNDSRPPTSSGENVTSTLPNETVQKKDNTTAADNTEGSKTMIGKDLLNGTATFSHLQTEFTEHTLKVTCKEPLNTSECAPSDSIAVCSTSESDHERQQQLSSVSHNLQGNQSITTKDSGLRLPLTCKERESNKEPSVEDFTGSAQNLLDKDKHCLGCFSADCQSEPPRDVDSSIVQTETNVQNTLYSHDDEDTCEDLQKDMGMQQDCELREDTTDETILVCAQTKLSNQPVDCNASASLGTDTLLLERNESPVPPLTERENSIQGLNQRKLRKKQNSPPVFIPQGTVLRILNSNQSLQAVLKEANQDPESSSEMFIPRPVSFRNADDRKTHPKDSLSQKNTKLPMKRKRSELENEIVEENLETDLPPNRRENLEQKFPRHKKKKIRAAKVKICNYHFGENRQIKRLQLTPFRNDQPVKFPCPNQPVVVLNHHEVDTLEVTGVMRAINKYKGCVQKVVLYANMFSLYLQKKKKKAATFPPTCPVIERHMLKMKLKKIHQDKYQVVGFVPDISPPGAFKCWFCARMFSNQEQWIAHGQRHLVEATRDWNTIQNPSEK